jgi:hypothetical protein
MAAQSQVVNDRIALLNTLKEWCLKWCFVGWQSPPEPANVLQNFVQSHNVPQEENILQACCKGLEQSRRAASDDLRRRLTLLRYNTAESSQDFANCQAAAWAHNTNRTLQLLEVWTLMYDLANVPNADFRGAKSILNVLKLCRTFSQ